MGPTSPPKPDSLHWSVALLGGFTVTSDQGSVELPNDAQRLVAFLALHSGRVPRAYVAGNLWGDGTQDRAYANLRSALWRLRQRTTNLIDADTQTVSLAPDAKVDIAETIISADRLCGQRPDRIDADLDPTPFTRELLPGWYDEWALVHRERLRQRSLHALEALADHLTATGSYSAAIQVALTAIALDPLRESPHRSLIQTHIAEGNYSEAIAHYHHYHNTLHAELGITPSPRFQTLLEHVIP